MKGSIKGILSLHSLNHQSNAQLLILLSLPHLAMAQLNVSDGVAFLSNALFRSMTNDGRLNRVAREALS